MDASFFLNFENILMIIPLFVTLLIYSMLKLIYKHKWKVIHLTVQGSALFFVAATVILIKKLFHFSALNYILLFFIFIMMIHLIIQWKRDTEVVLKKSIIIVLRINFLLFLILYSVLGVLMLVKVL